MLEYLLWLVAVLAALYLAYLSGQHLSRRPGFPLGRSPRRWAPPRESSPLGSGRDGRPRPFHRAV